MGAHVVFGVILGTGVGGGIVIGKELIAGHNKIAGEWGHSPLRWATESERPGTPCYCGKSGCVETFLSGAGLARDYHSRTGQHLTAKEISLAASGGDEYAQESLTVYQDRLARSLAVVINLLDPDVIVLGGGLSNIGQLYAGLSALAGITLFPMASTRPSCAWLTVIRAECVVPPGFGRPSPPRDDQRNAPS